MSLTVLIPAYKPGPEFPGFVSDLIGRGAARVLVVDDGSGPEYRPLFDAAARHAEVLVCRHAVNLGKGAALKTGINAALCEDAQATLVCADADGQHHADDVMAVARFAADHPGALVLGVRTFSKDQPLRSRFGNEATRVVMRIVAGQKLTDTQTGLRAIPPELSPFLLKVASQGYEFELDMLLLCRPKDVPIREVPIRTIYLNGNASSHFNPLLDSMRIYFVLMRFSLISICSAVLDNVVFLFLFSHTGNVAGSQVGGRIASMAFNFTCVKRMVFHSRGRLRRQFLSYASLVVVSGFCSYALITLFTARLGWGVMHAKVFAEGLLFLVNFLVQRDMIFTGGKQEPAKGA